MTFDSSGSGLVVGLRATSDDKVKTWTLDSDGVCEHECILSNPEQGICNLYYTIRVKSVNETLGVIVDGLISIYSECYNVERLDINNKQYFWTFNWDVNDKANFDVGYQVRDSSTRFYLPKVVPALESGSDLFTFCGEV